MHVILVSDTHLGARSGHFHDNWAVVADWIRGRAPDLVINTGDMSLDGADHDADLAVAVAAHRALGVPFLGLPGNHDIGDHPCLTSGRQVIDEVRRRRYLEQAGPDYWHHDAPGWRLIGLDALLIGSGLAAEREQRGWLADRVAEAAGRRLAVFLHKPFFLEHPDEAGGLAYWAVDPAARGDYRWLLDHPDLRLLASGHLHQHRDHAWRRAKVLWAPSTAFVVGAMQVELGGRRRTGAIELVFGTDDVEVALHELPGLGNPLIDDVIHEVYPPRPTA